VKRHYAFAPPDGIALNSQAFPWPVAVYFFPDRFDSVENRKPAAATTGGKPTPIKIAPGTVAKAIGGRLCSTKNLL
jgi:hypothetical protein